MTTDHPEWRAFLRAILASPEDDTPRLVAADWLEEHGETERGAFIRVQCELARLAQKHYHERTGTITRDVSLIVPPCSPGRGSDRCRTA